MKRSITAPLLVLALAGATTLASCTSMITEEQLAELQNLRNQERTLQQQLKSAEQERTRLQGEVDAQRAQLDRCNSDKQFVEGKLQQWPNVWPDWEYVDDSVIESAPTRRQ
jgi:uncharacterized protein (DUF3084 family)